MRIGTLNRNQTNRINFKDYIKKYWKGEEVELEIVRIFLPVMYNSFTLVMKDKVNNLEVKRTLSAELGKQLLRNFKLSMKRYTEGVLFLKIDKEGNQDVIYIHNPELCYEYKNNCFVLIDLKKKQEEEDDIPF
jgi:hypothetical protein